MLDQVKDRALTAASSAQVTKPASDKAPRTLRDLPYGTRDLQTFDVYVPGEPNGSVIFLVHGDDWRTGDKADSLFIDNKVIYWRDLGYTLVSANYRLSPQAEPFVQAEDVALALAFAQGEAKAWGCDAEKFLLMGFGTGGYLVAMINAVPEIAKAPGCTPWLGSVVLDCEYLDIPARMATHSGDELAEVFGSDPVAWERSSPLHCLDHAIAPMLLIRSTTSGDGGPAAAFAKQATQLGSDVKVVAEPISHKDINASLGTVGAYTDEVAAFIQRLAPTI